MLNSRPKPAPPTGQGKHDGFDPPGARLSCRPCIFLMEMRLLRKTKLDECNSYISQVLAREPNNYEALKMKADVSMAKRTASRRWRTSNDCLPASKKRPSPGLLQLARPICSAGQGQSHLELQPRPGTGHQFQPGQTGAGQTEYAGQPCGRHRHAHPIAQTAASGPRRWPFLPI